MKMNSFQSHSCSVQITIILLGIFLHAHLTQCCLSGRYGRYENWPSNNDWDELLLLVTGKYGNQGWGWSNQNSYAYNSFGNSSGSSGGYGNSLSSILGSSGNSGLPSASPSLVGTSYKTQKMKDALENYFNSNKKKPISSNYGGPSHYDGGSFDDHQSYDSPPPSAPSPSFSSGDSGGGSWGGGSSQGQSFNLPSVSAHTKNVGFGQFGNNNNQFQSDFDTFGGYGEKIGVGEVENVESNDRQRKTFLARNPARRRVRMRPGRFNPNRRYGRRQRMLESRHQVSRRKLNTQFGGYKVDHSRLRA